MKRYALMALTLCWLATPAFGISEFSKQWKDKYLGEDVSEDYVKTARRAGCYVCHVKRHPDKKEARNEYGEALHEYLDKEDYPKERIKAEPEAVKKEILAAFEKAGKKKSESGETFAEKIKAEELPAVDWEYEE